MFGRRLAKQARGQPIKASTINGPISVLERLGEMRAGTWLAQVTIAGTPLFRLAANLVEVKLAKTGGGGIAAAVGDVPGSATVRLWDSLGGAPADSGVDVTAYNWADGTNGAVGASKKVIVAKIDNDWYVIWELC